MGTRTAPALEPYVPRLLRSWAAEQPETTHRTIDGSMVFVDVSGFTQMSERLARSGREGAEEVTEVIGATFASLLAEAYAYDGSLLKFGGDALLLFFQDAGHESRAVAAAHGMRAELRRVGCFETSAGTVGLRMSIGAHAGAFDFFLVGASHRELLVGGPAASETVACEEAAGAGEILLSPALAAALPRASRGRPVGPGVLLRGRPPAAERSAVQAGHAYGDLTALMPVGLRELVLDGEVEPEHRSVTIAFLQYRGLDSLIARLGPRAAADAVDELVRDVQSAVDARGVTFLATDIAPDGGKIILTAGAPVVTGNDEESMLLALSDIVARHRALRVHIGVNRGHVFAGTIGPEFRRTFTVMGDAVNLAARLMAHADAGTIVATPVVLDGSRTLFSATELAAFTVKGKRRPVRAFEVGQARGSRAAITEAGLPLVGRDDELAALTAAWSRALAGRGQIVEVIADAGMGKSRLLAEFLSRTDGAHSVSAECRLYQSATPYFPFRAVLQGILRLDELPAEQHAAALEALVSKRAPRLVPWVSLVGTVLGAEIAPSPEVELLEERFRKRRLEESVVGLLQEVVTDPVVVTIEDVHWMDDASRELLARLAQTLDERRWLLVLTRRTASSTVVPSETTADVTPIELHGLGTGDTESLIEAATADGPLLPEQVRTIARRADGNPLFLIELLDALRRGDELEALPRSVEGLIQVRIDRLPPHDRTRLRHLAVLGSGFQAEHAAVVLDGSAETTVARTVRRLGDFLTVDRRRWVEFRHALIRDTAYAGLPYRARRDLHARVGDAILAAAGDDPDGAAELLAVHYFHARHWREAWQFARIAGERARAMYANVEAVRFYERALEASRGLPDIDPNAVARAWSSLADAREQAGDFDGAFDALRSATRLLRDDPPAGAGVRLHRARARIRTGAYDAALRETAAGLRLVSGDETLVSRRAAVQLLALRGEIRLLHGHPAAALELAGGALVEAEAIGELEALARSCTVLDGAYQMLGQPERAVNEQRALEIYRDLGRLGAAAVIEMNLGVQAYADGRWDEAIDRYRSSMQSSLRAGNEAQAATAGANLGEVLVSQGRLGEARSVLGDAGRVLRAARLTPYAIFAEVQLARVALADGRTRDAVEQLTTLSDEAATLGHAGISLEVSIVFAAALVADGEPARALAALTEAERAAGDEAVLLEVPATRVRASGLAALGRLEEAREAVVAALDRARAQGLLYEEALLLRLAAEVARSSGVGRGAEELQEADRLVQLLGITSG